MRYIIIGLALSLLAGCNAVDGLGQDISESANAVKRAF